MSKKRQTFGQILREARLAKGITLRKFAEMVGISPSYLSQVEQDNVAPPTAERVKTMATLLGANADEWTALAGRVPEDEGDAAVVAPVGEPVPGEHALAGKDELLRLGGVVEGGEGLGEGLWLAGQVAVEGDGAGGVENAEVERSGVAVHAGIESVLLRVETHRHGLLWDGRGRSPHRGWKATALPEDSTLGRARLAPVYPWDRRPPIPRRP
jgi:transcriptional regulator with XRE-family HTH domain